MIYVLMNIRNEAFAVASSTKEAVDATAGTTNWYETRNDWTSKDQVDAIATQLTEHTGHLFLGLDNGRNVKPRFDIFKAPKVGDVVSMGFNGDFYPCGKIVSISKTMKKIVTDNDTVFWRRGESARWLNSGTFVLVAGEHNERNPHF